MDGLTRRELSRLFRIERARFAQAFPHARHASLHVVRPPDRFLDRDYAYAQGNLIVVYDRILNLPRANVIGLLRHELGHVALPGGSEADADRVAYEITGRKIRYDRRAVQTVGKGGPRPRHLRNRHW